MAVVANKPSFISVPPLRFLIVDAPTDSNLDAYLREFKSVHVCALVRACACTYSTERVTKAGVEVHDLPFPDGDPPPPAVITKWLDLCDRVFAGGNPEAKTIAVHCVAGLGRAPVLVAIALIEQGLEPLDAVKRIREKRRGAINAKQLAWVEHEYKLRATKKACCAIM